MGVKNSENPSAPTAPRASVPTPKPGLSYSRASQQTSGPTAPARQGPTAVQGSHVSQSSQGTAVRGQGAFSGRLNGSRKSNGPPANGPEMALNLGNAVEGITFGMQNLNTGTGTYHSMASRQTGYSRASGKFSHSGFPRAGYNPNITSHPTSAPAVGLTYDKVTVGDLIWAPHFAPLGDMSIQPNDPRNRRSESAFGPIQTKMRLMSVLVKFPQHMLACPLYTHTGRGIGHKPEIVRAEFMALKKEKDAIEKCNNETPHTPLDVRFGPVKDESNLHLMAPIVVDYSKAERVAGKLTPESAELMIKTFKQQFSKAYP